MAEVPEGPPLRFRWRRMMLEVARAEGPERIAPEWWRAEDSESRHARLFSRGGFRRPPLLALPRRSLWPRDGAPALVYARPVRISRGRISPRAALKPRADTPPPSHRVRRPSNRARRAARTGRPERPACGNRRGAPDRPRHPPSLAPLMRASVTCGRNFRRSGSSPIRWMIRSCSACSSLSCRRRPHAGDDRMRLVPAEGVEAGERKLEARPVDALERLADLVGGRAGRCRR